MKTRWMAVALVATALAAGSAWADKRLDDAVAKAEDQLRKADDLTLKGRPDEASRASADAVKTMQKAVEADPQNPEALVAQGRVLLRSCGTESCTTKRDEAGAAFSKAVKLATAPGPVRAAAYTALADYELLRGSGKNALEAAEAAVKAESSAATLAVLARAQARVADPTVALQTAERAIQANAALAAAHEAKGAALLALGRTPDAVVSLRKAVELAPTLVSAKVGLMLALLQDNKAADALQVARATVQSAGYSAEAMALRGVAVAKVNVSDWGTGIGDAQEGARLDAKSALVQWAVGQLFQQNNSYDQAIAAYQTAVNLDRSFCPAAAALAQATYYMKGSQAGLPPVVLELAPANPFCAGVQLTYGEAMLRKEDYAKALPALEAAAKVLPRNPDAQYFLGLTYSYLGKINEASAPYGRAVELKPNDLDYQTAYGLALARAGDAGTAVDVLQKVVNTKDYKKPDAWINLGFALRMADRPGDAVTAYQRVVSADPNNATAAVGLAFALNDAKRWDEAIAAFRRAAELDASVRAEAAAQTARAIVKKLIESKGRDVAPAQKAYNDAVPLAGADHHTLVWVKEAIAAIVKGGGRPDGAPVERTLDMARLTACVAKRGRCPNAGDRARAVQELRDAGRDGVPFITFALREDPDPAVRNAARSSLEALKATACSAGNELKLIAHMECPSPCISCSGPEVKKELELCDSINAGRALGQRLVSSCGVK